MGSRRDEEATYYEPLPLEDARARRSVTPSPARSAGPGRNGLASYARRLHLVKSLYPWMKSDQAVALAKSPHGVRSETAMSIAFESAKSQRKRKKFSWTSPGDWVDKGAAAARFGGTALGAAGEAVGAGLPEPVRDAGKGVVRGGFTALQGAADFVGTGVRGQMRQHEDLRAKGFTPGVPAGTVRERVIAEAQANMRGEGAGVQFGAVENPLDTNTAAVAVRRLLSGDEVDLGEGFFPEGDVAEEALEAQRDAAFIRNPRVEGGRQGVTMGRGVAVTITEPGSRAYDLLSGALDLGVALADPVAYGVGATSKLRAARRTFSATRLTDGASVADEVPRFVAGASDVADTVDATTAARRAAGLIPDGTRRTVQERRAAEWLSGSQGRKVVDWLAENKSARDIWEKLPGLTPREAWRIAQSGTPEEARAAFEPLIGIKVREKPGAGFTAALPNAIRRSSRSVRLFGDLPGNELDANDVNQVAKGMLDSMRNAKVPQHIIERRFIELAEANGPMARRQTIFNVMGDINAELVERGVQPEVARAATRMFNESNEGVRRFNVDELGNNVGHVGTVIDGRGVPSAHPQLIGEYLDNRIPMPDPRTIRRLASPYRRLLAKTTDDNESLPRLPLVVADYAMNKVWKSAAVLRPALAVRIIAESQARMGAVGLDSMVSHPIDMLGWIVGRKGKGDILGQDFDAADDLSAFARSMSRRRATLDEGVLRRGEDIVPITTPAGATGLASELAQLAADPVGQRLAGRWPEGAEGLTGNHLLDTQEWFWQGAGRGLRRQLGQDASKAALLDDRGAADQYIEEVNRRLFVKTSGNHELLEVVASGKFAGRDVHGPVAKGKTDRHGLNAEFVQRVRTLIDEGVGPPMVKAPTLTRSTKNAVLFDQMDKVLNFLFSHLLGAPLDAMNYSPAFKQLYWRRAAEIAGYGTAEAKAAMLANAEKYRVPDAIKTAIRNAPTREHYSAADLHTLAAGYAAEESLKLLDNMTQRSQFADIARNFFPFAEAWRDALRAWSRIGTRQPEVFRRFQQVIQGAEGTGFFAPDPETGEEIFTFPLSAQINRSLFGVPIPFTGRVGGLNTFGENPLLPGFGPTVQLVAQRLLADKPQYDNLREFISPFGTEEFGGMFSPAWIEKAITAIRGADSDRRYASAVADTMAYLYSTGDYDLSTRAGMVKLERDARNKARGLFMLRAIGQAIGPTAPTPQWIAQDKNGDIILKAVMAKELEAMYEEDRKARERGKPLDDTANERFIAAFGPAALLFLQPKAQRDGGGPVTDAGYAWVRKNKGVVKDYPDAYGFFAPHDGEFSFEAYDRLIERGEIKPLTPREFLEAANARAARMVYNNARDRLGDRARTAAGRDALRKLRDRLVEKFPGYVPGYVDTGRTFKQIQQMKAAAADPRLAKNKTVRAIATYLRIRDAALKDLDRRGLATLSSKAARGHSARLREVAESLIEDTPAFADVFFEVFDNELGEG